MQPNEWPSLGESVTVADVSCCPLAPTHFIFFLQTQKSKTSSSEDNSEGLTLLDLLSLPISSCPRNGVFSSKNVSVQTSETLLDPGLVLGEELGRRVGGASCYFVSDTPSRKVSGPPAGSGVHFSPELSPLGRHC